MKVGMTFTEAIEWIKAEGLMDNKFTYIEEETEDEPGFIGLFYGEWGVVNGVVVDY